ncbi:Iron-dependent repressor IdeR/DtxR [Methanocaldococcus lauensis]|uniref:Iron-dependent repressor IdeR/DtxR n=1 Tax=Methanocaldococcus lauensis TaxID=2546128 RepID=A0A8D6PNZ7_9EURY|nr:MULTISPECIES: metal-dependent transcriptional regulator [Methanocaldococcus]MCQ6253699.1 metal-dependent transcriptional regulator [Methanocaldococcus sp.]CAB3287226.1 Iron-dependent repressor IdeR/DtxR [Methanocaldococcus lauensis]CAB3289674.1 Iron-dependent repressor IdeR/DtxR [Methanocaldococcus lauensis]
MSQSIEDYLEKIYIFTKENKRPIKTTELAKLLNIKPSAVTSMAQKLSKLGYVEYEPYIGITLTKKGLDLAKKVLDKHQTLQTFLEKYLGIDKEMASKEACKLEHAMSDEVLKKLKIFMEEHKDLVE